MKPLTFFVLLTSLALTAKSQTPSKPATIEYKLKVSRPVSHLYEIEMDIPGVRSTSVDVAMPAWAPGDYRIRDFARNVQEFSVETTRKAKLAWKQIDKQTWRILKAPGDDVVVRYRLYSNDLTDEMADISGPATFMYVPGNANAPIHIDYDVPSEWKIFGSLEKSGNGFSAVDYNAFADSPMFLGNFKVLEFSSGGGVPYHVVFSNPRIEMTERQVISDLREIADEAVKLFGPAPYKSYTFLVKVRSGGTATEVLEHLSSARINVGENDFTSQAGYRRFIAAASRAMVRSWIGKKIHTRNMDPIDYSKESYSRLLWFIDGASVYYADMLQVRTGFLIPLEYYAKMGSEIDSLQRQAARQFISLEDASLNPWTRSDNSAINAFSFASKDSIAALLLDLEIRGRTSNQQSLTDVIRYMLSYYGVKGTGIPEEGLQQAVTAVAGINMASFFEKVIQGTQEIDYNSYLRYAGLEATFYHLESAIYFGVEWERTDNNLVRIRRVVAGSPAERAQLDAGDVFIALDSERVTYDNLVNRIHSKRIGTPVTITLLRGERLLTKQLTPGESKDDSCTFAENPKATPAQIQLRNSWLGI